MNPRAAIGRIAAALDAWKVSPPGDPECTFAGVILAIEQARPLMKEETMTSEPARSIYVASRVAQHSTWRHWRDNMGAPIISTWIDEAGEGETADFGELWLRVMREVQSADCLILFASKGDLPLKGALVEAGIALGADKRVYVVLNAIELEGRTFRPIGSWIKHPNVTIFPDLVSAFEAALQKKFL